MSKNDLSRPSSFQKEVALKLGIDISDCKNLSAGAKIEEFLYKALHPESDLKCASDPQKAYAKGLGIKKFDDDSSLLISAKIEEVLLERNITALERLNLKSGDTVVVSKKYKENVWEEEHVVSSVGKNKRIYFKGIGCKGAWPTEIARVKN